MRILAIRGWNLNSLASKFEIDFESEPLKSAGLFAITGDTGAGKSTILDALCLALYAECPRLSSVQGKESVPDVSGTELQASDPKSCLRKGASEGHAEVDYLGNDGVRYRARWTARRAHNKASGKLQPDEHTLTAIDTDTQVANKLTAVRERVKLTTGLDYDEFRRTVLLAQGDFDALLRANQSDRADILEKITGTVIYRQISLRAHKRCVEAESVLKGLQDRRDEHKVMTPEERQSLQDEIEKLEEQSKSDEATLGVLQELIARHTAHEKAQADLTTAQGVLDAARLAYEAAADQRARLAALDRVSPLRSAWDRAADLTSAVEKASEALDTALTGLEEAQGDYQRKAEAAGEAAGALKAVQEKVEKLTPEWDLAQTLDAEVAGAESEALAAQQDAETASELSRKATAAEKSCLDELTNARITVERAAAALKGMEAFRIAGERWDETETKLRKRGDFARERVEATQAIEDLLLAIGRHEQAMTDIDGLDAAAREERAALEVDLAGLQAKIGSRDQAAIEERSEMLARVAEDLVAIRRASSDHCQAEIDLAAARKAHGEATDQIAQADRDAAAAEQRRSAAQALAEGLFKPFERAQSAVSAEAETLRLKLVPGEACPVCGSCEHPVHAKDGALATVAADLRTRYEQALADAETAAGEGRTALGMKAEAEGRASNATASIASSETRLARAAADYAGRVQAISELWSRERLPALPQSPADFDDTYEQAVKSRREACMSEVKELRDLRTACDAINKRREEISADLRERDGQREQTKTALSDARTDLRVAQGAHATAVERIRSSDRELTMWLGGTGFSSEDVEEDLEGYIDALRERSADWRTTEDSLRSAEQTVRTHEISITELRAQAASAATAASKAAGTAAERRRTYEEKIAARAKVLGGEATEAHRSRVFAERTAAETRNNEATNAASQAAQVLAGARQAVASATKARDDGAEALGKAQLDLGSSLAACGFERDEAELLLSVSLEDVDQLREEMSSIATAVETAIARVEERNTDVRRAVAAGLPEKSKAELEVEHETAKEEAEARKGRVWTLRGELQQDQGQQEEVAELDVQIAAAAEVAKDWREISQVIGSSTGDKFARYAQSITLELLVELANKHLAELNPRYSLVRTGELGFFIVDSEFGEERRSPRSLSGGERFLVSLALALALSGLGGRQTFADTLFIDEGFGTLDAETLDVAIDALEMLQSQGRSVGVISHVDAMKERIPVQIRVVKQGGGRSSVSVVGGAESLAA